MFFLFEGCCCKDIQQILRDIPRKKFLETLNRLSQPELPVREIRKIYFSNKMVGKTHPFSGNSGWKNKLRASKNFLE